MVVIVCVWCATSGCTRRTCWCISSTLASVRRCLKMHRVLPLSCCRHRTSLTLVRCTTTFSGFCFFHSFIYLFQTTKVCINTRRNFCLNIYWLQEEMKSRTATVFSTQPWCRKFIFAHPVYLQGVQVKLWPVLLEQALANAFLSVCLCACQIIICQYINTVR